MWRNGLLPAGCACLEAEAEAAAEADAEPEIDDDAPAPAATAMLAPVNRNMSRRVTLCPSMRGALSAVHSNGRYAV
jgi:hypothetical protein